MQTSRASLPVSAVTFRGMEGSNSGRGGAGSWNGGRACCLCAAERASARRPQPAENREKREHSQRLNTHSTINETHGMKHMEKAAPR